MPPENAWRIAACHRPCRGKRWGNSRGRSRARRPIRTSCRRPTSRRPWPRWSAAPGPRGPTSASIWRRSSRTSERTGPTRGARTAATSRPASRVWRSRILYLAFACTQDDTRALRAFERELEGELRAAFAKLRIEPARRDDARQQLWEKLFVGAPRPRILDYSGRGRLKFWFRVTVLRALLDELRSAEAPRRGLNDDMRAGRAGGRTRSRRSSTSRACTASRSTPRSRRR